ncbi:MAG: MBL fold metallo-hydrolase [Halodesulfurarchaeum sp.]
MDVRFLGGAREIGRSAILVDDRLLLDYGMAGGTPPRYPPDVDPDAVLVSHGHLDHGGMIPKLLAGGDRPPIHWTPPTRDLVRLLALDTIDLQRDRYNRPFTRNEVQALGEVSVTHGYGDPFEVAGYEVTFFPAGHIPGSAHVLVDDGHTRLLYTADFHTEGQRLLSPSQDRPAADVVIVESTYADRERPARESIEEAFVSHLRQTRYEGGSVVVPAFAIGRTQEILMICAAHDIECYVDGMGTTVLDQFRRRPAYVRDPEALRRASAHARRVAGRDGQRERIASSGTVIVTTAGMLTGGPAMSYVPAVAPNPTHSIALTGYQVEDTPGRELLERKRADLDGQTVRASATVRQFDFSAHADRNGLLSFLEAYRDATVLVNHGDACVRFADDLRATGFDAHAPERGETVRPS